MRYSFPQDFCPPHLEHHAKALRSAPNDPKNGLALVLGVSEACRRLSRSNVEVSSRHTITVTEAFLNEGSSPPGSAASATRRFYVVPCFDHFVRAPKAFLVERHGKLWPDVPLFPRYLKNILQKRKTYPP